MSTEVSMVETEGNKESLGDTWELAQEIASHVKICPSGPWMIPEITTLPQGSERGEALVLGVGGSTFRLSRIRVPEMTVETLASLPIPPAAKQNVFSWVASELVRAAPETWSDSVQLSWSFPLLQGRLQHMGKGFLVKVKDLNRPVIDVINEYLPRRLRVASVTHDCVASLVCGRFFEPECRLSLTLGTGINISAITNSGSVINTEISMVGSKCCPVKLTTWSVDSDDDFQPLECRVGGLYLGPIASKLLNLADTWDTQMLWKTLADPHSPGFTSADLVVSRAVKMTAAALYSVALSLCNDKRWLLVACTGGVVLEPEFQRRLSTELRILQEKSDIELVLVPEMHGSEVGAAIAGLACQQRELPPSPAVIQSLSVLS